MKIALSRIQFFLFLFIVQTGVVFITVQSGLIHYGGRDYSWLIFIVASIIFYLQLLFYEMNYKYFQIGKFVTWLYTIYWFIFNILVIVSITYVLEIWIFPQTPHIVLIILMVSVSFYANISRPETVLNLSVVLIPLIFIFIMFLSLSYKDLIWTNLLPIGTSTTKQWVEGLIYTQLVFTGTEIYLIYRKYVDVPDKKMKTSLFYYYLTFALFMLVFIMLVLLFFNLKEIEIIGQPLLYILKSQHVTFIERLDLIFLYIWLMWSIISFTLISFSQLFVFSQHYRKHKRRFTIISHVLLIIISAFLIDIHVMNSTRYILIPLYILFSMIIPFFVIVIMRRKMRKMKS